MLQSRISIKRTKNFIQKFCLKGLLLTPHPGIMQLELQALHADSHLWAHNLLQFCGLPRIRKNAQIELETSVANTWDPHMASGAHSS